MDRDYWNTTRWHTVVIFGALVFFVFALAGTSWLVGKKVPAPAPVTVKVAPVESAAVDATPVAAGSLPVTMAEKSSASAADASRVTEVPTPTPTPRPLRSPGGRDSIALPADEDPALTALPTFIPAYPGARTISCNLGNSSETTPRGSYVFATPDRPDEVGTFYREEFTNAGLVVSVNVGGNDHKGSSYTLIADGGAAGRSVSLRVDYIEGRSHGSVGFVGK